ncbi:hypothetical protein PNEG_01844 [Pneumocystis murina B123]|uniref:GPI mannosyltransferase 2 n=1 Tax=Pneumocystis murina (strain B123) TaxID=1069680 RepID=M7PI00_PNEMU|nr:hypothetical protein PNEG_01844 [Pneumocystis murina B123]EMR10094.1 hypothetical protein PNEG_01844 [Pneumocystis murina B123]
MKLRDLLVLTVIFLGYKAIFIFICTLSSFLNVYDTSTLFVLKQPENILQRIITSLVRWDNIYFITLAHRGLLFEQEWAFGPGFPYLVRLFTDSIFLDKSLYNYALVSIIISHLFHFFSIFILYHLTFKIYKSRDMAIVTSLLYLISPSGIFLSAGYSESLFSFVTFLGFIFFEEGYNFLAALTWCIASTIRSNGILWSIFFLNSVFVYIYKFLKSPRFCLFFKIVKFGIYSTIVCTGFFWIQYHAYIKFCRKKKQRNWCFKRIPSIYSFVQSYYWNIGFFKYFTVPQIPNFILAFPSIYLSIRSGTYFLMSKNRVQKFTGKLDLYYIAQLLLTILCICVMHIQVFTRMISCLPGIYWWLANYLLNDKPIYWVKVWVLYGMVQAVLFGAFLPPA